MLNTTNSNSEYLHNYITKVAKREIATTDTSSIYTGVVVAAYSGYYEIALNQSNSNSNVYAIVMNSVDIYEKDDYVYLLRAEISTSINYFIFGKVDAVQETFLNLTDEERFLEDSKTLVNIDTDFVFGNNTEVMLPATEESKAEVETFCNRIKELGYFQLEVEITSGLSQDDRIEIYLYNNEIELNLDPFILNLYELEGQPWSEDYSNVKKKIFQLVDDVIFNGIKIKKVGKFNLNKINIIAGSLLEVTAVYQNKIIIENDKNYFEKGVNEAGLNQIKLTSNMYYNNQPLIGNAVQYYWLLKDVDATDSESADYLPVDGAGNGWRCLNNFQWVETADGLQIRIWDNKNNFITLDKTNEFINNSKFMNKIKCLVKYFDNFISSDEIEIFNYDNEEFDVQLYANADPAVIAYKDDHIVLQCEVLNNKEPIDTSKYLVEYRWYLVGGNADGTDLNITVKDKDGADVPTYSSLTIYDKAYSYNTQNGEYKFDARDEGNFYCSVTIIPNDARRSSYTEPSNSVFVESKAAAADITQTIEYKYYLSNSHNLTFSKSYISQEDELSEWDGDWLIDITGAQWIGPNSVNYETVFTSLDIFDDIDSTKECFIYYIQRAVWTERGDIFKTENWSFPQIARSVLYSNDESNKGWKNFRVGDNVNKLNTFNSLTSNGAEDAIEFAEIPVETTDTVPNINKTYFTKVVGNNTIEYQPIAIISTWDFKEDEEYYIKTENGEYAKIITGTSFNSEMEYYKKETVEEGDKYTLLTVNTQNFTLIKTEWPSGINGKVIYEGMKNSLFINATYIRSGTLEVKDKFYASLDNDDVRIGGFEVDNNSISSIGENPTVILSPEQIKVGEFFQASNKGAFFKGSITVVKGTGAEGDLGTELENMFGDIQEAQKTGEEAKDIAEKNQIDNITYNIYDKNGDLKEENLSDSPSVTLLQKYKGGWLETIITYADGHTATARNYIGEDGPQGPQGATGPQGPQGVTGNTTYFIYTVADTPPTTPNYNSGAVPPDDSWSLIPSDPGKNQRVYMSQRHSTSETWSTPVPLSAIDGDPGDTPYIGSNGNWWIGSSDLGVKAEGQDAIPPEITIGEEGEWYIDGVSTGVSALGKDGSDIEFVYYRTDADPDPQNPLNPPACDAEGNLTDDNWTQSPQGVTSKLRYEYVSIRTKPAATAEIPKPSFGPFGTPALWAKWGENGMDGDGVEYYFYASDSDTLTKDEENDKDNWKDNETAVTDFSARKPYLHVKIVKTTHTATGSSSTTNYGIWKEWPKSAWYRYATGSSKPTGSNIIWSNTVPNEPDQNIWACVKIDYSYNSTAEEWSKPYLFSSSSGYSIHIQNDYITIPVTQDNTKDTTAWAAVNKVAKIYVYRGGTQLTYGEDFGFQRSGFDYYITANGTTLSASSSESFACFTVDDNLDSSTTYTISFYRKRENEAVATLLANADVKVVRAVAGTQGATGPQGPQGATGPQGASGNDGVLKELYCPTVAIKRTRNGNVYSYEPSSLEFYYKQTKGQTVSKINSYGKVDCLVNGQLIESLYASQSSQGLHTWALPTDQKIEKVSLSVARKEDEDPYDTEEIQVISDGDSSYELDSDNDSFTIVTNYGSNTTSTYLNGATIGSFNLTLWKGNQQCEFKRSDAITNWFSTNLPSSLKLEIKRNEETLKQVTCTLKKNGNGTLTLPIDFFIQYTDENGDVTKNYSIHITPSQRGASGGSTYSLNIYDTSVAYISCDKDGNPQDVTNDFTFTFKVEPLYGSSHVVNLTKDHFKVTSSNEDIIITKNYNDNTDQLECSVAIAQNKIATLPVDNSILIQYMASNYSTATVIATATVKIIKNLAGQTGASGSSITRSISISPTSVIQKRYSQYPSTYDYYYKNSSGAWTKLDEMTFTWLENNVNATNLKQRQICLTDGTVVKGINNSAGDTLKLTTKAEFNQIFGQELIFKGDGAFWDRETIKSIEVKQIWEETLLRGTSDNITAPDKPTISFNDNKFTFTSPGEGSGAINIWKTYNYFFDPDLNEYPDPEGSDTIGNLLKHSSGWIGDQTVWQYKIIGYDDGSYIDSEVTIMAQLDVITAAANELIQSDVYVYCSYYGPNRGYHPEENPRFVRIPDKTNRPSSTMYQPILGGNSDGSWAVPTSPGDIGRFCTLFGIFCIDGGAIVTGSLDADKIKANSITADLLNTNAIQSKNYVPSNTIFSTTGSFLDLAQGNFTTPKMFLNGADGEITLTGRITSQIEDLELNYGTISFLCATSNLKDSKKITHGSINLIKQVGGNLVWCPNDITFTGTFSLSTYFSSELRKHNATGNVVAWNNFKYRNDSYTYDTSADGTKKTNVSGKTTGSYGMLFNKDLSYKINSMTIDQSTGMVSYSITILKDGTVAGTPGNLSFSWQVPPSFTIDLYCSVAVTAKDPKIKFSQYGGELNLQNASNPTLRFPYASIDNDGFYLKKGALSISADTDNQQIMLGVVGSTTYTSQTGLAFLNKGITKGSLEGTEFTSLIYSYDGIYYQALKTPTHENLYAETLLQPLMYFNRAFKFESWDNSNYVYGMTFHRPCKFSQSVQIGGNGGGYRRSLGVTGDLVVGSTGYYSFQNTSLWTHTNIGSVTTSNGKTYQTTLTIAGAWNASSAVTTASDKNKKENIKFQSDSYSLLFDKLKPVTFSYKDGASKRTHTGLVAQDVEKALLETELTSQDFAALCYDINQDTGEKENYGIRYEELVSMCIYEIQKNKARIKELEDKLNEIKGDN